MFKHFKDFETMMEYMEGLKYSPSLRFDKEVEELNGFLTIPAHSMSTGKAVNFAKKQGLNIVTESIEDLPNGDTVYLYSLGVGLVNRERYYFVKKSDEFVCEELNN